MVKFFIGIITCTCIIHPVLFANDDTSSQKKTGWYPTPLPIIMYNTDVGFGYGVRMMLFNNGQKDDPQFNSSPYVYKLTAQFFQTTLGWSYHMLESDMPAFMNSLFRIKTGMVYEKKLNGNYFGMGPETHVLKNPWTGETYNSYHDYYYAVLINDKDNPVNYKFNKYSIFRPKFYLNSYFNLISHLLLTAGLECKWSELSSWQGRTYDTAGEKDVVSAPTLVDIDPRLKKFDQDGWLNSFVVGLGFDTRDYEPDPQNGTFIDGKIKIISPVLGSELYYRRFSAGIRHHISPFPFLTLSFRVAYTTVAGQCPFYELGVFSFLLSDKDGLGNSLTLRGYMGQRFIGNTMTVGNFEMRWRFVEITPFGQRFECKPLLFIDAGRVFNKGGDPFKTIDNYQVGYGGGFLVAWNKATIIHFYWGFSHEDRTFSMDVGHAID